MFAYGRGFAYHGGRRRRVITVYIIAVYRPKGLHCPWRDSHFRNDQLVVPHMLTTEQLIICICIYIYPYICIYAGIYVYMYVNMYVYMHVYVCVQMHVKVSMYMYMYTSICVYAYICILVYIYLDIYV